MAKRFNCYVPGFWRMLWLKMRYPNEWQHKCQTVITDTKGGYSFNVTKEEEVIMDLACAAKAETPIREVLSSRRQMNRAIEFMCDEILLAMYERRHGDVSTWSKLVRMSRDDWRVWWAGHEALARSEYRRERSNRGNK